MAIPAGRTLFKKKDGILTLTSDHQTVIWTPNTGGPPTVSLAVANITSASLRPAMLTRPLAHNMLQTYSRRLTLLRRLCSRSLRNQRMAQTRSLTYFTSTRPRPRSKPRLSRTYYHGFWPIYAVMILAYQSPHLDLRPVHQRPTATMPEALRPRWPLRVPLIRNPRPYVGSMITSSETT